MDHRKRITGVVISAKTPNYAHDELNSAKVGDTVTIEESRPLSALKRFRLVSIDKKAVEDVKIVESEELKEVLHEESAEDNKEAE